jgi:hypothetical protein
MYPLFSSSIVFTFELTFKFYEEFGGVSSCEKEVWRYGPLSFLYEKNWMNTQEKCFMMKNNENGV